jgi:hypothetical protein
MTPSDVSPPEQVSSRKDLETWDGERSSGLGLVVIFVPVMLLVRGLRIVDISFLIV